MSALRQDDVVAPKRTRLPARERRDQVLKEAARLVVEHGVEACTMEGVAAAAGVTKPIVYAHFANAEEVLLALARRESRRLDALVAAQLADATTFEQRLDALIGPYLDAFLAPRSLFRVLALGLQSRGQHERSRLGGVLMFLGGEIVKEFGLSRREAELAAAMLYGGFEAIAAYSTVVKTRRADLERVIRGIVLGGLRELAAN